MAEIVTLKFRRGTTNEWVQSTRPLAQGEPGFDVVSGALKIGDGMSSWQNLPGFFPSSNLVNYVAGTTPISIGYQSSSGVTGTVAVGGEAGSVTQGSYAVALGRQAGFQNQGVAGVAMGIQAGYQNQGTGAVAIGVKAGYSGQGRNAIAIGTGAGTVNQADNSIILNASDVGVTGPGQSGAFYVSPVRNAASSYVMNYNPTTSEVSYSEQLDSSSRINAPTRISASFESPQLIDMDTPKGTSVIDLSFLLATIKTFPVFTEDNSYRFDFNIRWRFLNEILNTGFVIFTLESSTTNSSIFFDIEDIAKKSNIFGLDAFFDSDVRHRFNSATVPVSGDLLQLIVVWTGDNSGQVIQIESVELMPHNMTRVVIPYFDASSETILYNLSEQPYTKNILETSPFIYGGRSGFYAHYFYLNIDGLFTYTFEIINASLNDGDNDTYFFLFNTQNKTLFSEETLVASDDDDGSGFFSKLIYTGTVNNYCLVVSTFTKQITGSFTLQITRA
jgi:hypothetical protein